jgi:hypothetical protein
VRADHVTYMLRHLSVAFSRRGALRLLAAAVSGALALLFGLDTDKTHARRLQRARRQTRLVHRDRLHADRKRKKKKKKGSPPTSPPPASPPTLPSPSPAPTRQTITRTFTNFGQITVPSASGDGLAANPYPATIVVSGFTNGVITDVNVILLNFNHTRPSDVDVLLSASQIPAVNAIIMSDAGGDTDAVNASLVLDDQATTSLPAPGPLTNGAYRPTNSGLGDTFSIPAPAPSGNSALSAFNGGNPNGTWQLFAMDDTLDFDMGSIAVGWALEITAEADV